MMNKHNSPTHICISTNVFVYYNKITRLAMNLHKSFLYLLLIILSFFINSCRTPSVNDEAKTEPFISTTKSVYLSGDLIKFTLTESVKIKNLKINGKTYTQYNYSNDSLFIISNNLPLGIHQTVIYVSDKNNRSLTDTFFLEIKSNVIPKEIRYKVVNDYPHLKSSFTQGLEFHNDKLYESTGLNGYSSVMNIDIKSGLPVKTINIPSNYFGEGITIFKNKIYQLTWKSGICFQYNLNLEEEATYRYSGEGWGITHNDTSLITSDGTNKLTFYSESFNKLGEMYVYDDNGPIFMLNELEYVNGFIFANVWQTNKIVKIDARTGKVVGNLYIDSKLPLETDTKENVLNGIAYNKNPSYLYITGKNWPSIFKIKLAN